MSVSAEGGEGLCAGYGVAAIGGGVATIGCGVAAIGCGNEGGMGVGRGLEVAEKNNGNSMKSRIQRVMGWFMQ